MAIADVAKGLTELCQSGQFHEAMERYYAPDIVSVEAEGLHTIRGIEGVREKAAHWYETTLLHSCDVEGPFVHGDQFTVVFKLELTPKASGQRMAVQEVGLYTVREDKIVHESFFEPV